MMQKRRTHVYTPDSSIPFYISRSKIALFLECPACFYLDRRLGITRPDMFPLTLNNKVDASLKEEFDALREQKKPHRLMQKHRLEAIPFWHPHFPVWRDDNHEKIGAVTLHHQTHLNIHGIVDDIWINTKNQELYVVDYKATSNNAEISLDSKYREGYKKQIEVYQWIFRRLGFNVSRTGYFLFANANKNFSGFHDTLEFETSLIPYQGDDSWVERTIIAIKKCLDSNQIPESGKDCKYCGYRKLINKESLKTQTSLL